VKEVTSVREISDLTSFLTPFFYRQETNSDFCILLGGVSQPCFFFRRCYAGFSRQTPPPVSVGHVFLPVILRIGDAVALVLSALPLPRAELPRPQYVVLFSMAIPPSVLVGDFFSFLRRQIPSVEGRCSVYAPQRRMRPPNPFLSSSAMKRNSAKPGPQRFLDPRTRSASIGLQQVVFRRTFQTSRAVE